MKVIKMQHNYQLLPLEFKFLLLTYSFFSKWLWLMEFNVWISIIRFQEQRGEPQRALALRCWQNQSSFPRTTSHHETQSGAGKTSSPSECASPSSRCFTRLNSLCFPPQTKAETFKGRNSDPVFVFLCFIYIHSLFNGNYDSYFERVITACEQKK